MAKIGICGHYGGNKVFLDGQTVKTKTITQELKNIYGEENVLTLDTYGGVTKIFSQIKNLIVLLFNCENVMILPAHNSLRVFAPILCFFNKFKHKKLHYIVIGGWLPKFLTTRPNLSKCLKNFNYIYVETSTMKKALVKQGFNNVVILPNCKDLKVLKENELIYPMCKPYKLCTFSRVTEKKGIEDAINVVREINEEFNEIIFSLDIYGQIDPTYEERFKELVKTFPEYIKYKGCVESSKSVDVIKNYFFLLFPTRFYTEGIPGTIIDAYAAGVPVIASKWESFGDVIKENVDGIGYEFSNYGELIKTLKYVADNPKRCKNMKLKCIKSSQKFSVEKCMEVIKNNL